MRRRHIARQAVQTAIIVKAAQRLGRRAETHLGRHWPPPANARGLGRVPGLMSGLAQITSAPPWRSSPHDLPG